MSKVPFRGLLASPLVKRFIVMMEQFIAPALRADPVALGRARNHVAFAAVALAFGFPIAGMYACLSSPLDGVVILIGVAAMAFSVVLLRLTPHALFAGEVGVSSMYALFLFMVWRDGATAGSSTLAWFALVPIIGSFVGGYSRGLAWAIAATAGTLLCSNARRLGFDLADAEIQPSVVLRTALSVCFVGVMGAIAVLFQLSKEHVERQLSSLALFDALTGLPNRHQLSLRMEGALQRRSRSQEALAVLYLDLDGFKAINDVHGHGAGDDVLKEFGRRLSASVRGTDTVARLAGDEFIVVLERLRLPVEAATVAKQILGVMDAPVLIDNGNGAIPLAIRISTSIGIAYEDTGFHDCQSLLAAADLALYASKTRGRGQFEFATPPPLPPEVARA